MANFMEAIHVHEYPDPKAEGQTKTRWTKIGVFFPPDREGKTGGTLIVNPGVSVTGKIVMMPIKKREDDYGP